LGQKVRLNRPKNCILRCDRWGSSMVVIARGAVGERAVRRGVASDCIVAAVLAPDPGESVHACGAPAGHQGFLRDLIWGTFAADRPYFGIYGKVRERKGSFAILAAMHGLMSAG
jgi:hypothetical protein